LEVVGINGKKILKEILKVWLAPVKAGINLIFHATREMFL
jgi:hypothetical protein